MAKPSNTLGQRELEKKRTAPSEVSSDIGTEQEAIHLVNWLIY